MSSFLQDLYGHPECFSTGFRVVGRRNGRALSWNHHILIAEDDEGRLARRLKVPGKPCKDGRLVPSERLALSQSAQSGGRGIVEMESAPTVENGLQLPPEVGVQRIRERQMC